MATSRFESKGQNASRPGTRGGTTGRTSAPWPLRSRPPPPPPLRVRDALEVRVHLRRVRLFPLSLLPLVLAHPLGVSRLGGLLDSARLARPRRADRGHDAEAHGEPGDHDDEDRASLPRAVLGPHVGGADRARYQDGDRRLVLLSARAEPGLREQRFVVAGDVTSTDGGALLPAAVATTSKVASAKSDGGHRELARRVDGGRRRVPGRP